MKLYLYGHEYKYAVEQMLLTLFPTERPEYPEQLSAQDRIEVRLSRGGRYTTASCLLVREGKESRGRAAAENSRLTDELTTDRVCQRLIKNAMYRAALSGGLQRPPWGALTGVRPGKLMAGILQNAKNGEDAVRSFRKEYDVSETRARLCLDTSRETLRAIESLRPEDVCLYIGIPFCPTRCAYCSFVSQSVEKSMKLIPPFLEALEQEIDAVAEQLRRNGLRVVSVYFGGGTPTTLSAAQLERLLTRLEQKIDLREVREFTIEAGRPDTITEEKLRVIRSHGVDRVSVNPQTMSDRVLEIIGRRHTAADIEKAFELVRRVNGLAVNMDLIAGLPGDTEAGFAETMDRVLALRPENLTIHTLSLKKGSRIMTEGAELPGAEEVGRMLDLAAERMRPAGYSPYYLYRQKFMSGGFENVGWTQPGFVNLYNICIMEELCSIIAMGGGGSTKLVKPGNGRNIRLTEPKYPQEYIENIVRVCEDKNKIGDFYASGTESGIE